MPEDQRVTSYSSPTGKLQMRAATNVEHRAIVNNEQHVVDEVESSAHDTRWICAVSGRGGRQKVCRGYGLRLSAQQRSRQLTTMAS